MPKALRSSLYYFMCLDKNFFIVFVLLNRGMTITMAKNSYGGFEN